MIGPSRKSTRRHDRPVSRRELLATASALCAARVAFPGGDQRPHVTAIAFTPDGSHLVLGWQAGVSIQDTQGNHVRSIDVDLDNVHDLRFSPDGRTLAVAGGTPGESGAVQFVEWPGGRPADRVQTHDDVIYQVDFASDGSRWVAASADEVCSVYETGRSQPLTRFTQHSRPVLSVAMLPDRVTAVSASRDETLRVWDTQSGNNHRTLHNHSRDVYALALRPGGTGLPMVASASADRTVRFWQPTIGRMVRFARLESEPHAIAWVGGGARLVAGCRDGMARVVDPATVQVIGTYQVGGGWLHAVDADPTRDDRVAVGGSRGLVKVLSL